MVTTLLAIVIVLSVVIYLLVKRFTQLETKLSFLSNQALINLERIQNKQLHQEILAEFHNNGLAALLKKLNSLEPQLLELRELASLTEFQTRPCTAPLPVLENSPTLFINQPTGRDTHQVLHRNTLGEWIHHSYRNPNHPDIQIYETTPGWAVKHPDGRVVGFGL